MITNPKGNPNMSKVGKISHHNTGPASELGKLKVSLNSVKYPSVIKLDNGLIKKNPKSKRKGLSKVEKILVKNNIDPQDPNYLKYFDSFTLWLKTHNVKELKEEFVLMAMTQDMLSEHSIRTQERIESGNRPMTDGERNTAKLIKDFLTESHKMKYGSKFTFEKKIDMKDIRRALFDHLKEKREKEAINAEVIDGKDNL